MIIECFGDDPYGIAPFLHKHHLRITGEDRRESDIINAWWRAATERGMRMEARSLTPGYDGSGAVIEYELREGPRPDRDPLIFGASA